MTFNDFKNWLKSEGPVTIRTLGGRSKIKISLNDESKVICVNSPGTEYPISQETFERTMKQYNDLKKDGLNTVTVQYTDTNWSQSHQQPASG